MLMAWSGNAYYRSVRVNGRPRRVYVGSGATAEAAAAEDKLARAGKELERAQVEAEQAEAERLDANLKQVCAIADSLAKAALYAAGYRQHCRGDWRRNHGTCGG
jgi:hypothetical protein